MLNKGNSRWIRISDTILNLLSYPHIKKPELLTLHNPRSSELNELILFIAVESTFN